MPVQTVAKTVPVEAVAKTVPVQTVAKTVPVEAVAKTVPVEAVAKAIPEVLALRQMESDVIIPFWYSAGWDAFHTGDIESALESWEDGLRKLDKDRRLIASNGYNDVSDFAVALKSYSNIAPTFGMRQSRNGQLEYRLVVISFEGPVDRLLPLVKRLYAPALELSSLYLQDRLHATLIQKKQVKKTAQKQRPNLQRLEPKDGRSKAPVQAQKVAFKLVDWQKLAGLILQQLKAGNYTEVEKNARQLTAAYSQRWEGWFWLGTALLGQGQMDGAEMALERAIRQNATIAEVWVQRAIVAQERGNHALALEQLNQSKMLAPNNPQVYLNMGFSFDALKQSRLAGESYQYFLRLTKGNPAYFSTRSSVMNRLEHRNE